MQSQVEDCDCEVIQVSKEESEKCEAYPEEEKEKDIPQYGLLKKTEWDEVTNIINDDGTVTQGYQTIATENVDDNYTTY